MCPARCENLHRLEKENKWKTILWTDESTRSFIALHYPWFLQKYNAYKYDIQRVDVARYFILYHFGGIYIDMDIGCRTSLEQTMRIAELCQKGVILPTTKPLGFSNDFIASTKAHEFFDQVMHSLEEQSIHGYGIPYLTVMFSTGPIFLSLVYHRQGEALQNEIAILGRDLYTEKILRHLDGNSWHSYDVKYYDWIRNHTPHLMVLACCTFIVAFFRARKHGQRIGKLKDKMVGNNNNFAVNVYSSNVK